MTILRDGSTRQVECDECPNTGDEFDADEFANMIAAAKAAGWEIRPSVDGYSHTCPDCQRGSRLARAQRMFG